MRFDLVLCMLGTVISTRPFQYDAPTGRWLDGEYIPRQARPALTEGSMAACPTTKDFCIDTRWSDARTCLYPMPHLIKRCYDESCIQSSFGFERKQANLEDTYCKDFMDVEGRVCQYNDFKKCTCPSDIEDVAYANAVVVYKGESVPPGYRIAPECIYPSANIKRLQNGGYVDPPLPGQPFPPAIPDHPKLQGDLFWKDPADIPVSTLPPLRPRSGDSSKSTAVPSAAVLAISVIILVMCTPM